MMLFNRSTPSMSMLLTSVQARCFARSTRSRVKDVLNKDMKKLASIEGYFDKVMRRRHESEGGAIDMPRRNFEDVLHHYVHNEDDYT